jgi:hypothetical protein
VTVESVGQVAIVPDDFSPLQLGVTGQFERRHFTVVGRLRKVWEEGSWNEWCVLYEDRRFGWLGEAQGDWVMTFEDPAALPATLPPPAQAAQVAPGARWGLGGRQFAVTDVRQVTCDGAEGELAEVYRPGEEALCIDLQGQARAFATLEFRGTGVKAYVGRFVDFDECRFANLRQLPGWGSRA